MDRKSPKDGVVLFSLVMLYLKGCGCLDIDYLELNSFEIIIPRKLMGLHKREAFSDGFPEDHLSYVIPVDGKEYTVHLEKNIDSIGDNFTIYTLSKEKGLQARKPDIREFCNYKGYVEGIPNSEAVLTACSGRLSGLMNTDEVFYEIVPLQSSSTFQHVIYDVNDVLEKPLPCGVLHSDPNEEDNEEDNFFTEKQYLGIPTYNPNRRRGHRPTQAQKAKTTTTLKKPTTTTTVKKGATTVGAINPAEKDEQAAAFSIKFPKSYVELYAVVDNRRYVKLERSESAVKSDVLNMVDIANQFLKDLNLKAVLTGLEIWTDVEPFSTQSKGMLPDFSKYASGTIYKRQRYDMAIIFIGYNLFGSVTGLAYGGNVCTAGGTLTVALPSNAPTKYATTLAHEIGHSLGFSHDVAKCICKSKGGCIMRHFSGVRTGFSSCSKIHYDKILKNKGCLLNTPKPIAKFAIPICGNKVVDIGEECDCGSLEECNEDPCCMFSTCQLISGAQCGFGQCCENCQMLEAGTVCRDVKSECDFPEFCDGFSQYCPDDVYVQDGTDCMSETSYCYGGDCTSYTLQCQELFGPIAQVAAVICFEALNARTDEYGHCGSMELNFTSCVNRSAMCGKIQCDNIGPFRDTGVVPTIIGFPVEDTVCSSVGTIEESDVADEFLVKEGTACGLGKVCVGTFCMEITRNSICDPQLTCNDHGVCNNKQNCHCEDGWAPPKCDREGRGGSTDSGPTYNDKGGSQSNTMVIGIVVGVVVLIIIGVLILKRDALRRLCGGSARSEDYTANETRRPGDSGTETPSRTAPGPRGGQRAHQSAAPRSSAGKQPNATSPQASRTAPNSPGAGGGKRADQSRPSTPQ